MGQRRVHDVAKVYNGHVERWGCYYLKLIRWSQEFDLWTLNVSLKNPSGERISHSVWHSGYRCGTVDGILTLECIHRT